MTARSHGSAGYRSGLAGRDAELLAHDVDSIHHLGDRVLDLQPGIHLEEIEPSARREEELDRSGSEIPDRGRGLHGGLAHCDTQVDIDRRRGGFLYELLVAALY